MDMPLVSVITVVYNGAATIEQTIQSVLNQSYKNIEYIIIDGKSTDGTQKVIEQYKKSLAYFISEEDNGLYNAMNKGIKQAKGEIIGIVNSDDWYEQDAIAQIVRVFTSFPDIDILYGDMNLVDKKGNRKKYNQAPLCRLWHEMSVSHPATFVKKEIYEKYGTFDETYQIAADFDLMNLFYNKKLKFAHIGKVITNYRWGGVSTTNMTVCRAEVKRVRDKYFNLDAFGDICYNKFFIPDLPLFIFGSGEWGGRIAPALKQKHALIYKYLDNDSSKWGTELEGIPISSPEILKCNSGQVFVAIERYEEEIIEQLQRMNLENCHIIRLSDCLKEYEMFYHQSNGDCLEVD